MPKPSRATQTKNSNLKASKTVFTQATDQDMQQIRDDVDSRYTPSVVDAIKQYISKAQQAQGYSKSQWLNHKIENNMPLNANEAYMDKYLQQGMHDLGKDIVLNRTAHMDVLEALGVKNYYNYSEQKLNSMLKGASWKTKAYSSSSYDAKKNPFAPGQPGGNGREIVMNIKAKKTTQVVFGAKAQAEIIINKGTQYKITGVHYDGTQATPRNASRSLPRLVLDIEIV